MKTSSYLQIQQELPETPFVSDRRTEKGTKERVGDKDSEGFNRGTEAVLTTFMNKMLWTLICQKK